MNSICGRVSLVVRPALQEAGAGWWWIHHIHVDLRNVFARIALAFALMVTRNIAS